MFDGCLSWTMRLLIDCSGITSRGVSKHMARRLDTRMVLFKITSGIRSVCCDHGACFFGESQINRLTGSKSD